MTKIGVIGHRCLRELDKVKMGIKEALHIIEDNLPEPFILFSSLAEGADQLIVSQALKYWDDARLVILPALSVTEYLDDFFNEETREIYLGLLDQAVDVLSRPEAPTRELAYAMAGQRILDLCDVLIAIWDGQIAHETGRICNIMLKARESCVPLIWIHAGSRISGTNFALSLGEEQGKISLENFDV